MSMKKKTTVTCSACGTENDFVIWQSLNSDLDPEAKQRLIEGTLFDFKCKKCGHESKVSYPILYHDMAHNVMIHCVSQKDAEEARKSLTASQNAFDDKLHKYTNRIVTNPNALREKAIIFEHGLDDRVIEIIKLLYYTKASERFPEANITDVFFLVADGKYFFEFIADKPFSVEVPAEMYENIKHDFAKRLEDADSEEVMVDMHRVAGFLRGK